MHTFSIDGKTVSIFPATSPDAPVLYFNTFAGEGEKVLEAAQAAGWLPFTLVAISNLDWNHDLAPWNCPAVFPNAEPCTGGADDYLRLLTEKILPAAETKLPGVPCWRGIVGYSLARLFALYAVYQRDLFSRVGSISGSLWFPGIREYLFSHQPKRRPDRLYFSLGDKENRTRNPVLQNVRQNTEEIHAFFQAQGMDTVFHLNPGSHYNHVADRTAAGIRWLLGKGVAGYFYNFVHLGITAIPGKRFCIRMFDTASFPAEKDADAPLLPRPP